MYTKEKLTQEINTIIIDKLGVEPNEVIADATLFDLGADELDQVELVMNFEREFDVTIPYEIAETFVKISDIYSFFFIHFKVEKLTQQEKESFKTFITSLGYNLSAANWRSWNNLSIFI